MALTVWSEREPGAWDECTEAAYLMVLVHAGFRRFREGAYTDAERDGLEMDTPRPLPVGSTFDLLDQASHARYGITLHRLADGSRAGLRRQLRIPGQALAIAGSLGKLPTGHRLRRWQPTYVGGHAICVVTLGEDRVLWLDPLAPMRFEGDTVQVDRVLEFAYLPSDARVARQLELAGPRLQRLLRAERREDAAVAAELRELADELAEPGG